MVYIVILNCTFCTIHWYFARTMKELAVDLNLKVIYKSSKTFVIYLRWWWGWSIVFISRDIFPPFNHAGALEVISKVIFFSCHADPLSLHPPACHAWPPGEGKSPALWARDGLKHPVRGISPSLSLFFKEPSQRRRHLAFASLSESRSTSCQSAWVS